MKAIQGLFLMLAALMGLVLAGALMVTSANAQPRTAPVVTIVDGCDATNGGCSTGQGIFFTILPPGETPPPTPPPTTTPAPTPTPTPTEQPPGGKGPGAGSSGTGSAGPDQLPKTGPRETAIMAGIGVLVLQLGLLMAVRTIRAMPRAIRL